MGPNGPHKPLPPSPNPAQRTRQSNLVKLFLNRVKFSPQPADNIIGNNSTSTSPSDPEILGIEGLGAGGYLRYPTKGEIII